jgi:thiol-disulfide isomerase/thioredoxin
MRGQEFLQAATRSIRAWGYERLMRRRLAVPIVAIVTLLLLATPPRPAAAQSRSKAEVVRALLALQETDLDGRSWTHAGLRGRITLVDFWATWCAPCRRELPFLKEARERYGDDFQILGVSLDKFSRGELQAWMAREGVDWPQLHARGSYDDPLSRSFGVDRLPLNFLLDASGRLRVVNVRGEQLFVEIENLLPSTRTEGDRR